VETYTLREAADLTGLNLQALRSRVDRGQIRAVKPGRGKARRIPRSELEAVGLSVEPKPATTSQVVSDLLARLEEQAGELASLRQLEAVAGSLSAQVEAEQQSREIVELEVHRLRAHIEAAKTARFWRRRRVLETEIEPAVIQPRLLSKNAA
jgi:excisionase family DNA binding protein